MIIKQHRRSPSTLFRFSGCRIGLGQRGDEPDGRQEDNDRLVSGNGTRAEGQFGVPAVDEALLSGFVHLSKSFEAVKW